MVKRAERLDRLGSLIGQGGTRYRRLLKMLIESGGMYCLTWLILLCLIITGSMASHVFLAIIGQLTVSNSGFSGPPSLGSRLIPDVFFLLTGARQGIYPTLIIVLVSLNLAQDRDTQGPVDTGLKFSPSTVNGPTRTVSFSLAHAPSSSAAIVNKGDVESGGIELAAEARSGRVCVTKIPDFESNPDVKGIFVHQVTDVS
jgi:hypothetical protein